MTLLDSGGQRSRSHLCWSIWSAKPSTSMLGCQSLYFSYCKLLLSVGHFCHWLIDLFIIIVITLWCKWSQMSSWHLNRPVLSGECCCCRSRAYKEPWLCHPPWSGQTSERIHTRSRLKAACRLRVSSVWTSNFVLILKPFCLPVAWWRAIKCSAVTLV